MTPAIKTTVKKSNARVRRGSALLVCTVAAVVISFVVLALARTTQISHLQRKSNRDVAIGNATAEGLFHRAKASGSIGPIPRDRDAMIPQATGVVVDSGATRTVQVVLYRGGPPMPAKSFTP